MKLRSRLEPEVSGDHQRWVRFLNGRDVSFDVEVDFYTVLTLPYPPWQLLDAEERSQGRGYETF